jgi:hypothetical protein
LVEIPLLAVQSVSKSLAAAAHLEAHDLAPKNSQPLVLVANQPPKAGQKLAMK